MAKGSENAGDRPDKGVHAKLRLEDDGVLVLCLRQGTKSNGGQNCRSMQMWSGHDRLRELDN